MWLHWPLLTFLLPAFKYSLFCLRSIQFTQKLIYLQTPENLKKLTKAANNVIKREADMMHELSDDSNCELKQPMRWLKKYTMLSLRLPTSFENAYREVTKRPQDLARDKADHTWLSIVQDRLDEVRLVKHTIENK
jgi:hypothetical protein